MSFEWNYDTYKWWEHNNNFVFQKYPKNTSPPHLNQPHPILKTKQNITKTKIPRRTENEANTRCLSRWSCTYQDVGTGTRDRAVVVVEPKKSPTFGRFSYSKGPWDSKNLRPEVFGRNHSSEIFSGGFWSVRFLKKNTTLFFVNVLGSPKVRPAKKKNNNHR